MKKKTKLYLAIVIILGILLFASVFAAVGLTGGREIGEMTGKDLKVFYAFLAFFIIDAVLAFVFANRLGKLVKQQRSVGVSADEDEPAAVKTSPYEKALNRRGVIILAVSFVICLALGVLGVVLKIQSTAAIKTVLMTACVLPVIIGVVSYLLFKKKSDGLKAFNAEERQNLFLEQRRSVEQKEREALKKLKTLRRIIIALAVLLVCLGAVISLLSWVVAKDSLSTFLMLYATILMASGLCRLFIGQSEKAIERDEAYVKREEYPYLYSLAEKAAEELGCNCRIRIAFIPDNNIGVAQVGDTVSLLLGVYLIGCLTDKELYAILLHEFSHIAAEADNSEANYALRMQNGTPSFFLSGITDYIFIYPDFAYGLQYMLYSYAVSVTREAEADEAMLRCGDKRIAASALIKVFYLDRSDWEDFTHDIESVWVPEEPQSGTTQHNLDEYRRRMEERGEFWSSLIPKEILSRSASHPTLKMRLDSLGVDSFVPFAYDADAGYVGEVEKAVRWYDGKNMEFIKPEYKKLRKHYYLDHLEKIDKWESEGRPLSAEGYRGIVEALRALGRRTEAEALCDRAIAELPPAASAFARFTKAKTLLRRYDPAGVELMYEAVEDNTNYIDEGMSEIGAFCCMTGDEKELELYRQRALEIAQRQIDEYDQMGELKKTDDLSPERLPEGKLEEILAYIASIEKGEISKIYLVHKKISERFFASVFIIEFKKDSGIDAKYDIIDKVFNYLDTESDWQYALFDSEDVKDAMPKIRAMKECLVYSKE